MTCEIVEHASAKVNLNLRVLPARADGFHDIESIFQTISLADTLVVRTVEGTGRCSVICPAMVLPEANTLTRAYDAFCTVTGGQCGSVSVELTKRIPAGGGLGGGSSDAAALIRALEKLNGVSLTDAQLDSIAAAVGSDVFFFVHCDKENGGCAVVSGRGERVKEICKRRDLYFALIFPGVHSSTKEAYALVDKQFAEEKKSGQCMYDYPAIETLETVYNLPVGKWNFVNTFTRSLSVLYPEIGRAVLELRNEGAAFCDMSGSGSTVYGVFASREEAENAVKSLGARGMNCVLAI